MSLDGVHRLLRASPITERMDSDIGSLAGEGHGKGPTDPAVGAGHEC